jgi:hypothetical protein
LNAVKSVAMGVDDATATYVPASALVRINRDHFGPEVAITLVEARAPNGFANLHDVISKVELEAATRQHFEISSAVLSWASLWMERFPAVGTALSVPIGIDHGPRYDRSGKSKYRDAEN